jgi:hypothetical protein
MRGLMIPLVWISYKNGLKNGNVRFGYVSVCVFVNSYFLGNERTKNEIDFSITSKKYKII